MSVYDVPPDADSMCGSFSILCRYIKWYPQITYVRNRIMQVEEQSLQNDMETHGVVCVRLHYVVFTVQLLL